MSYKFKVGDRGKTRGGKDYEVIAVEVVGLAKGRSIVVVVEGYAYGLTAEGKEYGESSSSCSISFDLLPPEQYLYVNIFTNEGHHGTYPYSSEDKAKAEAARSLQAHPDVVYHAIALPVLLKQGNG